MTAAISCWPGSSPPGGPPAPAAVAAPWTARRQRAGALLERYPFARGPLGLYRALLDVQEPAWAVARQAPPDPADLPAYAAARVLPRVMEVTAAAGPPPLRDAIRRQYAGMAAAARCAMVRGWLDGTDLTPVERYLARASAGPVLEALGPRAKEACAASGDPDGRHCPACGGLPQLAYIAAPPESLAAGPRSLVCSRCAAGWPYPRLTCAACGEQNTARLTVLAEDGADERSLSGSTVRGLRVPSRAAGAGAPRFPHVRVDACESCGRYLLSIDLGRDPHAVPVVDELAAIPLDLHAVDRGFTKVVPNLMEA
jgi:hypothetical protein